jgi:hypothetical protein
MVIDEAEHSRIIDKEMYRAAEKYGIDLRNPKFDDATWTLIYAEASKNLKKWGIDMEDLSIPAKDPLDEKDIPKHDPEEYRLDPEEELMFQTRYKEWKERTSGLEDEISYFVQEFHYCVNITKEHRFVRFEVEPWAYNKGIPKHIKKLLAECKAQVTNIIQNYGLTQNKKMPTTLIEIELGANTKLGKPHVHDIWREVIKTNKLWFEQAQDYYGHTQEITRLDPDAIAWALKKERRKKLQSDIFSTMTNR